jgi:hypothetical protein
MTRLPITYVPRPDATPEGELNALANVCRLVLLESNSSEKNTLRPVPERGGRENLKPGPTAVAPSREGEA